MYGREFDRDACAAPIDAPRPKAARSAVEELGIKANRL
jgi:hypothetical protein